MRREKRNSRPSSSIKKASGGSEARSRLWLMPRKGARGRWPPCTGSTPPAPFNKRLKQPRRGEDFAPALGGLEVYVNQLGGHERTNAFLQRFEPEGQEAGSAQRAEQDVVAALGGTEFDAHAAAGEEPRGGSAITHGLFHGVQPRSDFAPGGDGPPGRKTESEDLKKAVALRRKTRYNEKSSYIMSTGGEPFGRARRV